MLAIFHLTRGRKISHNYTREQKLPSTLNYRRPKRMETTLVPIVETSQVAILAHNLKGL